MSTKMKERFAEPRIRYSVILSIFSFLIVLAAYFMKRGRCPDLFSSCINESQELVLFFISLLALIFLIIGYLGNFFDPEDTGDAFTVLDLGLIASWCRYFDVRMAVLYALPVCFRIFDVEHKLEEVKQMGCVKQTLTRSRCKIISGQCLLLLFFWIATVYITFAGERSYILTFMTPGTMFYVIAVFGVFLGIGLYLLIKHWSIKMQQK